MVSIIICCYNATLFIDRCFNSLLSQTYKHLEIILVDDGSTDHSYDIASSYKQYFETQGMKLVLLKQNNQGAGYAAAHGLLYATGDYIMCFDIDDYLYPESIAKMRNFLVQNSEYSVVRTNGYRTKEFNSLNTAQLFITEESEKKNTNIFKDLMLGKTNNWAGSYMVRASVLWKQYPTHKMLASRYGQNLQILAVATYKNKTGFIDEPLMQYINNPYSFTNKHQTFEDSIKLYNEFEKIRFDILNYLQINDNSLKLQIKELYYRIKMNICISFNKKKEFFQYYNNLKKIHCLSFEDKLNYAIINKNSICKYFYLLIIKLNNWYAKRK